jgi:dipeptidyl aminopeptidase/acylaminoacyl peptidase
MWALPLDGTPATALVEDADLEVEGALRDPFTSDILGATLGGPEVPPRWLNAKAEKRSAALHRSFSADWITLVSRSADYQKVIVLAEDKSHPPTYYLVDYAAKKADIVGETYPLLSGVALGVVRDFRYQARDQYPLTAYLTLPPGAAEKNLPLVVLPHGGPAARDEPGFDWLAQFLSSRGYAVLQPQFRGSTGFGRAHEEAGYHQWGLRMQDDVSDGVRAAIEQGIADPKRVCIVGWSYGGYAALAGAAFTPELYTCAASINGVSDLPLMLGMTAKEGGQESNELASWRKQIGAANDPQVIAKSPARAAPAVRAPILLLHGTDDTVVPIVQSETMARALDAAGKPYSLVRLKGDDHQLSNSVTRIQAMTELEAFLAKYLSPAVPAAAN